MRSSGRLLGLAAALALSSGVGLGGLDAAMSPYNSAGAGRSQKRNQVQGRGMVGVAKARAAKKSKKKAAKKARK